ncbi:MAG: alanine--tRNA ligase, partial [Gemmataceae bacterium]|nr:alanine--tRNA ligase [Gemmataceae bacterium]
MTTPPRSSDEIRASFLRFFQDRGHVLLPGWPLVPVGDPSSLFTSAGMQQFKPMFMGVQPPPAPRTATVQRCFRTTDIEEVGDLSHLTCFEMLGNFSFGDYFKKDAIAWAWELLTGVYTVPADRLHVTVYLDDDEAYQHWRAIGVPDSHLHRCGEDKNYWFSGPTGPCGPDSEIYYDFFPERGLDGVRVAYDDDRFLEIWNLVFMQLYQHEDGSRTELPARNIDTGSGLERVAAVLQGKRSVYETDIFLPILREAATIVGVDYIGGTASEDQAYAIRAMSEHCRAAAMLVGDGVVPSNEGRGYVLRRILRRAVYFARRVGVCEPFTARLAGAAIDKLKGGYPHLAENREFIERAIRTEEERFLRTLAAGSHRLEALLDRLGSEGGQVVPGQEAFLLYDTFGLPLELTREISAAAGFTVDEEGYRQAMDAQRRRAREQGTFFRGEPSPLLQTIGDEHSAFLGYDRTEADAVVVAILREGALAGLVTAGQEAEVVLDATPFYPEGGGQIGDRGNIRTSTGVFAVEDTQTTGGAIVHRGRVIDGEIRVSSAAEATVDRAHRRGAARNHTGTHLLHAALRTVLGPHVRQQGSLVTPDRLRFD